MRGMEHYVLVRVCLLELENTHRKKHNIIPNFNLEAQIKIRYNLIDKKMVKC